MAKEPQLIDLLRYARNLRFGDVIGVQNVDQQQLAAVLNRSGNKKNPHVFNVPGGEAPRMRAMFMGYNYDAQANDKITSLSVMLIAPTSKLTNVPNTPETLMLTQGRQKEQMGLDPNLNWRLVYLPINITPDRRHTGASEEMKVWRYGYTPNHSLNTITDYLDILAEKRDRAYMDHGYLSKKKLRQLRGETAQDTWDKITDANEVGSRQTGGQRDARAVERIEAAQAEQDKAKRAQEKTDAAEAAKAELKKQKESPSGTLAFNKLKMRFNEQADPDISLENAHTLDFISEDDLLYIETIAPAMGISSLRGAYDAVVKHPVLTLAELVKQGICSEDEALDFKKSLDARLKDGVVQFFERARPKSNDLGDKIIPYAPPRAPENL